MYEVKSEDFDHPYRVDSQEGIRGLIMGALLSHGWSPEGATRWAAGAMAELRGGMVALPGGVRIEGAKNPLEAARPGRTRR